LDGETKVPSGARGSMQTLLRRIVANVATLSPHLPSGQASLEADFTTVLGRGKCQILV